MSLRLTPFVPESPSDSDRNLFLQGFQPVQPSSAKPISSLLPFVKLNPSSTLPLISSVGEFIPQPLDPASQSSWVVQATWHLYALPRSNPLPADSISLPAVPQLPVPQEKNIPVTPRSFRQYLRYLLLFSCGAAVSTVIYANPFANLKEIVIPSASPESFLQTVIDPAQAQGFIETAQRQLYHLDRLAVQENLQQRQPFQSALEESSPLSSVAAVSPVYPTDPVLESQIVNVPPTVEAVAFPAPPDRPVQPNVSEAMTEVMTEVMTEAMTEAPLSASSPFAYRVSLPIPGNSGGELVGLLEQGDQSMALFKINGTIEQVTVGERLANGATFVGVQEGKTVLQMGESQVPLAVGQAF